MGIDDRMEAALSAVHRAPPAVRAMPDFAELHQQRQQHAYVTQQLLWEEYREANPDGYGYSRFCELYQRWRRKQDVVLRQEHKAGEKLFIDWAGRPSPSTIRAEVPKRRICSSLYWAPVRTPLPKPPATSS